MSEISGFDWWFRNREYVLRENLESVEATSMAAAARSARLSSQLSRLQGSLEHRLSALSAAFDAYVQLGDVREQLDAFGDTAAIRREAIAAIGMLGDGKPAKPVDVRGTGYWVAPATNAVIARVTAAPDTAAEAAIAGQEPDATLFLVAASGALGHGAEVAGSVVRLLHTEDGQLTAHQLDLWQAVLRGDFGSDAIKAVLSAWNDQLTAGPDDWWAWATEQGTLVGRDTLDWIEDQLENKPDDKPEEKPADSAADRSADDQQPKRTLRDLVLELINSGFGEEKQLLATARALRARIEHPESTPAGIDQDHSAEGSSETAAVVDVVRAGHLALPQSAARSAILTVLAPRLVNAVEPQATRLVTEQPAVTSVRVGGKSVEVTPQGPDQQALTAAIADLEARSAPAAGRGAIVGLGVATVVAVVVALVLALLGKVVWLVVLLLIAAVICGVLTVRAVLASRQEARRREAEAAERDKSIKEATERASTIQTTQRRLVRKTADQLDRIRAMVPLPAEQTAGPTAGTTAGPTG